MTQYEQNQDRLIKENEQLRQQIQEMEVDKFSDCINTGRRKLRIMELKTSETI